MADTFVLSLQVFQNISRNWFCLALEEKLFGGIKDIYLKDDNFELNIAELIALNKELEELVISNQSNLDRSVRRHPFYRNFHCIWNPVVVASPPITCTLRTVKRTGNQ